MRWEDVIKLLARLTDKERALIKEDVAKDVPPEQPWTGPHQNTMGIPYFKLTLPGNDWAGKDLSFEFQLVDGTGILSTRKKPTIRSPKLQHEGFNLELYCPEAPEKGLRYILSECSLRSDDDKVLKEFKSPGKADFDVKAENFVTIVWESFDSLDERSAEMTKVVVVIRVLEIE